MKRFSADSIAVCVEELPGYTTVDKQYTVVDVLESVGRLSIVDDNGKECHVSQKRFMNLTEYAKLQDEKKKEKTMIYASPSGELSLWRKQFIWHKWMAKTPKAYADAQVRNGYKTKEEAYGPCFWGMEKSPEELGLRFLGYAVEA